MRNYVFIVLLFSSSLQAQHEHHQMHLDDQGMVMHENSQRLPNGCESVSSEQAFEVRAGVIHAKEFADKVFSYNLRSLNVKPCSRVTITFINDDQIRHQWMLHDLPRYLHKDGMFHIEAAGKARKVGVFIAPAEHKTYRIHCDVTQHTEKGMKAQLVVGKGSGDLWSIPGVSADFNVMQNHATRLLAVVCLLAILVAVCWPFKYR